jgi:DNA-binding FadR family transcriptional regulator
VAELKPLNVNRLHTVVIEALENEIFSGRYKKGDLLPSEAQLAAQLKVGRRAVREALRALEAKGLVQIRMGVGTRVVRNDLGGFLAAVMDNVSSYLATRKADLKHIFELRTLIERYAFSQVLASGDTDLLNRLDENVRSQRVARLNGDSTLYHRHHIEFHMAIVDSVNNPIISMVFDQLLKMILTAMFRSATKPAVITSSIREHAELTALLRKRAKPKELWTDTSLVRGSIS